ncbi:MAG: FAD-dependent oxidoreductase [Anaerolineales bacterium]|nr:FAD-dependent oxidoreductase [Anaerolineales bacterium]
MYDLIVVGGGPAGLTATIYAIRKRLNVLLVTKDLGGKTNYRLALPWVNDYQVIRGLEVINKFRSELEYLDFARHMEPADKILRQENGFKVVTRGGGELMTKAVIITTGTKQQRLNVPGEKDYMMKGLCYSALSYAPLFIDRKVVVIGDGDLAQRSTAELATVAQHVTMLCPADKMAITNFSAKLRASANVEILEGYQVVEVKGDEFAKALIVKDAKGQKQELVAEGTFVEMSLVPNSQIVDGLVKLDDQKRIIIDCSNRTNVPGIFAAGDVTNTYAEQVLVAVGEGTKATLSAYDFLLTLP